MIDQRHSILRAVPCVTDCFIDLYSGRARSHIEDGKNAWSKAANPSCVEPVRALTATTARRRIPVSMLLDRSHAHDGV
jgi:hypothetical protein